MTTKADVAKFDSRVIQPNSFINFINFLNEDPVMTPIHYFWVGETFSNLELLTFRSCRTANHEPWVWTYSDIKNAPAFVKLKQASTILPEQVFLHYLNDLELPLANISDIFRYHLLHKVGGYYSDTDVVVMKNFDSIPYEEFFCSTHEYGWGQCANGCFMKVAPGSAVSQFLMKECEVRLQETVAAGKIIDYCHLGPFVVQKCASNMPVKVVPYDYINPISWRWVRELIAYKKKDRKFLYKTLIRKLLPGVEKRGYGITRNTFAVHLCNEMWKANSLNKNSTFHSSSVYEKLKATVGAELL